MHGQKTIKILFSVTNKCQSNPVLFVLYLTKLSVNQFWLKSVEILDVIES